MLRINVSNRFELLLEALLDEMATPPQSPFVREETVERLDDLEIGQMSWQLHAVGAERGLIRTIDRLKTARDSLAHLQPLSREACFHSDLIG